jgi:hypothetical protein
MTRGSRVVLILIAAGLATALLFLMLWAGLTSSHLDLDLFPAQD